MRRIPLSFVLALAVAVPPGCITVDDRVDGEIRHGDVNGGLRTLTREDLAIEHIVYASGSHPTNEAMNEVLKAGIVPAYVNVRNTSAVPVRVSPNLFRLVDSEGPLPAIPAEALPRTFKHFNPEALAANVANVVMITAGILIVIYAVAEGKGTGGCCMVSAGGGGGDDQEVADDISGREKVRTINPLTKVTYVDYGEYLLPKAWLAPGESTTGLVFFRAKGRAPHWQSLQLQVRSKRKQ